jgi:hypothetical protein
MDHHTNHKQDLAKYGHSIGVFMLTSIIAFSAIPSNAIPAGVVSGSIQSITTITGLPPYWHAVISGLVILLYLKEVLAASEKWNSDLNDSFNTAIIPLTLSFIGIVIFEIRDILISSGVTNVYH